MSADIEMTSNSELSVEDKRAANIAQFRAVVESMKAQNIDDDPETAMESMIAQVMGAVDVSDVLGNTVTGLKDMLKTPIFIDRVELRPSDFEQGLGAYAVLYCRNDKNENLVVTTGSFMVIVQLAKFQEMNAYPVYCMAVESEKATKSGYYPLSLTHVPNTPKAKAKAKKEEDKEEPF